MELVCNLAWLAVTIVLWGVWGGRSRHATRTNLLPAIAVQLIALCALTAILLPVISITDDLQASSNPAEVERSAGKRDQFLCARNAPHALGTVALIAPSLHPFPQRRLAILPIEISAPAKGSAQLLALWSRPPPVA